MPAAPLARSNRLIMTPSLSSQLNVDCKHSAWSKCIFTAEIFRLIIAKRRYLTGMHSFRIEAISASYRIQLQISSGAVEVTAIVASEERKALY